MIKTKEFDESKLFGSFVLSEIDQILFSSWLVFNDKQYERAEKGEISSLNEFKKRCLGKTTEENCSKDF